MDLIIWFSKKEKRATCMLPVSFFHAGGGGTGLPPSLARCPAEVFIQPVYAVSKYLELEAFFPSAVVAKT